MSNESIVWNILPDNSTVTVEAEERRNAYVVLLVILSIFLVGSLTVTSVVLIFCRRCYHGGKCCNQDSDDPEKTTTTYMEESHPTHEITIRVDESDCLSMASSHDQETERFLSTGTTGRRVSFNEAALFDHSKKAQEKGRRYTLTEGDFHHLKNARLTNLSIPAPALKIVTIHECDSAENTITMTTRPPTKSALSIFQPMLCPLPQTPLTSLSPSGALPGDALNSVVDTNFNQKEKDLTSIEMMTAGAQSRGSSARVSEGPHGGTSTPPVISGAGGQGPMLQFFTKLRRHASLEGASPYLKIKKWKLDSSQRASSLDTRGSPKRRHFQRQRAASESMDQDDNDTHRIDLIQYIARTRDASYRPSQTSTRQLSPPSTPPPSLGRVEVEVMVEPSSRHEGPGVIGLSPDPQDEAVSLGMRETPDSLDTADSQDPQTLYRDIWTLRATLEQYAISDQSGNNDRNSVCSDVDSVCSLGGRTEAERGELPSYPSQDLGDEAEGDDEEREFTVHTEEKMERRVVRKQKQGSTDSERGSDGETTTRKLLQMDSGYASIEAPYRGPEEFRLLGNGSPNDRTAHEKRHHFTRAGRSGTIGESFESHLFEEDRDDELSGARGGVSTETSASSLSWQPYGQMLNPREASQPPFNPPPVLHRRDYSIDEKTDALFHEFLRHDPQFDLQESPLKKHRSRIHLRKQWQRHKQWSDPGVRHLHSSFERQRTPLRRGESVNYPIDTSYHSTLPRIVSAPDEDTSSGTGSAPETPKTVTTSAKDESKGQEAPITSASCLLSHATDFEPGDLEETKQSSVPPEPPDERSPSRAPDSSGYGPQTITAELTDKLSTHLDEKLYLGLRSSRDSAAECVSVAVTVTHTSPEHSPV